MEKLRLSLSIQSHGFVRCNVELVVSASPCKETYLRPEVMKIQPPRRHLCARCIRYVLAAFIEFILTLSLLFSSFPSSSSLLRLSLRFFRMANRFDTFISRQVKFQRSPSDLISKEIAISLKSRWIAFSLKSSLTYHYIHFDLTLLQLDWSVIQLRCTLIKANFFRFLGGQRMFLSSYEFI